MQAAILYLVNMEFIAKVRTDRTVQHVGRQAQREEVGMQHEDRQVWRQKLLSGQRSKQTGMQTVSHPYRKLENVLTSRQQVLRMEFLATVQIGRRQQAAQREQAGMQHADRKVWRQT